jgi:protein-S-isoprenylcysteine O-methyltransferase Ste14
MMRGEDSREGSLGESLCAMRGWRILRAIVLLPGTMTVLLPALLLYLGEGPDLGFGLSLPLALLPAVTGAALLVEGLLLVSRTISLFAEVGKGTLAPWDPTQRLVVLGPYRHVRNPMISGVLSVLLGEALALGSVAILVAAGIFFAVNAIYIPLVEEPGLRERFGDDYGAYSRNVPRWIPRLRPWVPDV